MWPCLESSSTLIGLITGPCVVEMNLQLYQNSHVEIMHPVYYFTVPLNAIPDISIGRQYSNDDAYAIVSAGPFFM